MSQRLRLGTAIRLTIAAFRRDNASRFGAALAFYIVFSIAPMLLIAIGIAGSLYGRQQAEQAILDRLSGSFGSAAGTAIAAMIRDAPTKRTGWFASLLGLMTLYFGLAGVYRQIDDALRTIWGTKRGQRRLGRMIVVFGAGAVVVLSVVADAAIAVTGRVAAARLHGGELWWHAAQLLASTLVLAALFAVVFRALAGLTWRDVRVGATVTAILFVLGKFALGVYLGRAAVGSAFGAAGSVVVVLLWSYWSALIFFFGLELIHVYAGRAR